MNTHIYTNQKGFIALFFTLSVSSLLLVYISLSSSSVFDFMRTKDLFVKTRDFYVQDFICADGFIDMIIRQSFSMTASEYSFVFENYSCDISDFVFDKIDDDNTTFLFTLGSIQVKGYSKNGFVTSLKISNLSL